MNHEKLIITLLSSLLAAASASAQLVITSSTQSTTIDFQSDVGWDGAGTSPADPTTGDNVFKFKTGSGNFRSLLERETSGWTASWSNDWGMSTDAWSWSAGPPGTGLDLGMGAGTPTQFENYNNDADLGDFMGTINAVAIADQGTLGIGAAGDKLYRVSQATAGVGPFRDYTLTLRVHNVSGATISDWNASLDTWYNDVDSNVTAVTLRYSTDNVTFSPIDSYTPVETGGIYVAQSVGGEFSVAIGNNDYLYIQLALSRPTGDGSGSDILFDNWSVAAVSGAIAVVVPVGVDVAIAGEDVQLTFDSVDGQSYQLLVSTDDMASFAPVSGATGTGDGNPMTLTDTGGAPASGETVFYQVDVN